jgi:CubicO group peptidase (beta-lactamase class C family)
MAKSITSLLVGAAIKEGKIKSVDELVGNYLSEFKEGLGAKLKIKDLLTMSSGSNWNESYINPFAVTTEAYYGSNVYKTATGVWIVKEPGTYYAYKSGDTELLALIVEKATGKSLSKYASEKLWQPIGAEHAALWSNPGRNRTAPQLLWVSMVAGACLSWRLLCQGNIGSVYHCHPV